MVAVAAAVAGGSVHAHRCRVEEEEMDTFFFNSRSEIFRSRIIFTDEYAPSVPVLVVVLLVPVP
jgi:hypothetical protein